MNEAGGWNERTTVEDMDLAVRASMHGWKFVYLHDLEVTTSYMLHTTLLDCPDIIDTNDLCMEFCRLSLIGGANKAKRMGSLGHLKLGEN
jgi:hypothetical protein